MVPRPIRKSFRGRQTFSMTPGEKSNPGFGVGGDKGNPNDDDLLRVSKLRYGNGKGGL